MNHRMGEGLPGSVCIRIENEPQDGEGCQDLCIRIENEP